MTPGPSEHAKDPFNLERFIAAQDRTYSTALSELKRGSKRTHWMWYVFPQLGGLGHSAMAHRFAIASIEEARAYLEHRVLGTRLQECVEALQDLPETTSADQVFGAVDAMKLRSSLTLFVVASPVRLFEAALERWFVGPDPTTLRMLKDGK